MRFVVAALLAPAVLALAACGGGGGGTNQTGPRLTKDEFISRADGICGSAKTSAGEIDFGIVDPTSAEATKADLRKLADALARGVFVFRKEIADLRKLRPPADFDKRFGESLGYLDGSVDAAEKGLGAARRGDKKELARALDESDRLSSKASAIARDYGLVTCGG